MARPVFIYIGTLLLWCLTCVDHVFSHCQIGSVNFVRTSNVRPLDSILDQIRDKSRISSLRCHQRCIDSNQCTGYLYDRKLSDCYLITSDRLRLNHQNMIRSPDWSYHRRICLTTDSICSQAWAFESFGASHLHSIADKIMWNLNSEENCINACSSERQFVCRSAIYDHINKSCSLHSADRHSAPDMLAAAESLAANNLLYMENHCIQQGCEIWRTHFEMNAGYRLSGRRPFKRMYNHQPGQCVQMCKQDESCRSLSVDYSSGTCEFFDDPQQNEQLAANLVRLGARLAKRSVHSNSSSGQRTSGLARRIVARLNVSDLNLDGEFPTLDDDLLDEDIGPDGEPITFLPEPGLSSISPIGTQASSHLPTTSSTTSASLPSSTPPTSTSRTTTTQVTWKTSTPSTSGHVSQTPSTSVITNSPIMITSTTRISTTGTPRSTESSTTASTSTSTTSASIWTTATNTRSSTLSNLSPAATTAKTSKPMVINNIINSISTTKSPPMASSTVTKQTDKTLTTAFVPLTSPLTLASTSKSTSVATSSTNMSTTSSTSGTRQTTRSSNANVWTQTEASVWTSETMSSTTHAQQIESNTYKPEVTAEFKECAHCAHFTKVCLNELNSCGTDWSFEVIPGHALQSTFKPGTNDSHGESSKQFLSERLVRGVVNRADCQSECLKTNRLSSDRLSRHSQDHFVCRSAVYEASTRLCRLFSYTRHSTYGRFARLLPVVGAEYMENNCVANERGFCTWNNQRKLRLLFADRVTRESNLTSCQDRCASTSSFYCRSVSFETSTGVCALSHHSGRSLADHHLFLKVNSDVIFSEIRNCFSVSVDCGATEMIAKINSLTLFQGRVYARDRPATCSIDIQNATEFQLPIQLNGPECGTKLQPEADFSNVLVIQSNDQVLTAIDKAIGLKCSYNVHNITGEATLQFSELDLTDQSRSSAALPELSLHITDLRGNDRNEVNLGELLKVQVRLSDEDTYGIFVRNLIARDSQGNQNLTLIDQSGCPAHSKLMREMRTLGSGSKQLESYFEAFSFTGSPDLNLEAEVETCVDTCRPVQCQVAALRSEDLDDVETVVSYGRRRRRRRELNVIGTKRLSQQIKVRSARLGVGSSAADRLVRKNILDNQADTSQPEVPMDPYADTDIPESSWTRTGIVQTNSYGFYCFGFSSLAVFSGLTMLIQCVFFLIALVAIGRIKSNQTNIKPININQYSFRTNRLTR